MGHRLAMLAATALAGATLFFPLTPSVVAQAPTPGVTMPDATGALARGGQFTGSLTITRLTNRAGQLVADGLVTGNVTSEAVATTPTPASISSTSGNNLVYASTSTPTATIVNATAETFASTSTPTVAVTVTPTTTATIATTSTAAAAPLNSVSAASPLTGIPVPDAQLPRAELTDTSVYQATTISQAFREIPLGLVDPDMGSCDVLLADLGTVFIDQLGMQLDLAPAVLDLATLPRANRPLGGLLCTVASLLDLGPGSTQAATVNELLPIVNRSLSTAAR
jgi:hypothetical protein